jgi:hypothetical protein
MKTKEEILLEFGKSIVARVYDPSIDNLHSLRKKDNPPALFKDYVDLFKNLSDKEFLILEKYIELSSSNAIFNFLKLFEEDTQFKICHVKDQKHADLTEMSEMLKAEQYGDNGWISKFSKYK